MATQYVAPVNGTWAAKTSSPFGAARDGGHRLHAGSDLQAANGAPAVAAIGGKVIYAGHNSGYQWNAVVVGDDGNAFRYATHGPLSVKVGDRVEQGQQIGTIARGHLHLEVIPGGSPVFNDMVAHPGTFVGTQFYPGGKPVTVDPTAFFGVERGARIAAGKAVGSGAGTLVPEVVDDPFGVAKFQREQAASARDEQGALASLEAPGGGSSVPDMPTAAMGYAPDLPGGMPPPAPPMPQIMASAKAPLPTPPPQWVNGGFPQDTMLGGTTPPMPRMRDQGALEQQRADQLDSMLFGAGPHRGDFARGRPEGRWTGAGGAPDASLVPAPNLNPFNPAVGGPNDRRPQPPMPNMRPEGRWVAGAGGAPDAASVPNPPSRGTPFSQPFPSLYGEQPSPLAGGMSAEMGNAPPSAPPTPPRATPEFWNSIGLGSRGTPETQLSIDGPPVPPPDQPPPSLDGVDSRSLMAAMEMGQNRKLFQGPFGAGELRPQSSPPPGTTPPIGNVNYSDMPIQRLPQTQAAVNVPGMGLGPYGMTPPPAEPNFANADPGPTFVPPGGPKDIAIPRSPFEGSSGTGFTYAPPMPAPPPATSQMSQDQFNISFSPGGPGMIADLSGPRPTPPQPAPDPFAALMGPGAAIGAVPFAPETGAGSASPRVVGSPADAYFYTPKPLSEVPAPLTTTPPAPSPTDWAAGMDTYVQNRFSPSVFAPRPATETSVVKPAPGQDVTASTPGRTFVKAEDYFKQPPVPGTIAQAATMNLPEPPPQRQRGPLGRFIGGLLGGPIGALGGGLLGGGGGGFGFGGSASFTPIGPTFSTPYNQQVNGQMGQTTVQQVQSGNMQGPMWNRSGGGSVGYVTDPFTGAMIYSASPSTF